MKKFHLDPEKYHCKDSDKSISDILPTSYGLLYIGLPIRFFETVILINSDHGYLDTWDIYAGPP